MWRALEIPSRTTTSAGVFRESGAISRKVEFGEVPERQPVLAEVVSDDLWADPAVGHQSADHPVSQGSAGEDRPDLLRAMGRSHPTSVGVESRPRDVDPASRRERPACFRHELTALTVLWM